MAITRFPIGTITGTPKRSGPAGSIAGGPTVLSPAPPAQVDTTTTASSQTSAASYHSTLFEDFRLEAESVYNFYVPDEQTTVAQDPSASLDSLPRYVVLSWNPSPPGAVLIPQSFKGVRPVTGLVPSVGPALNVAQAKDSTANGYIAPGTIRALVVPPAPPISQPTYDEDGFLLDPTAAGSSASSQLVTGSRYELPATPSPAVRMRVSFVDPSVAGAFDQNRISVAGNQVHLASLASLAKLAGGLEVISEFNQDLPLKNLPPRFTVSSDAPTLSYVGYVIERHTLGPSGSMLFSKLIDVDGQSVTSYVDRDVSYGATYAYRIRSLVQWTHPSDVGFDGRSTLLRLPPIRVSAPSPQKEATFYAGDWSDWSQTQVIDTSPPDPPDELTVLPMANRGEIRITWKVPGNPQLDLASLVLLRAEVGARGISDWRVLGEFVPANGCYDDLDVVPFRDGHVSYVYAMYSTSLHGEISTLSEQVEARAVRPGSAELPVVRRRPAGADPRVHASGPTGAMRVPLVARGSVTFYCRGGLSSHPLFSKSYVVEARSLSTGESVEIDLTVDSTDVEVRAAGPLRRA